MEFRNRDFNSDNVKLYECQRKSRKIYEVEPEAFSPATMRKNPCEILDDVNEIDLREYQVKVKLEIEH